MCKLEQRAGLPLSPHFSEASLRMESGVAAWVPCHRRVTATLERFCCAGLGCGCLPAPRALLALSTKTPVSLQAALDSRSFQLTPICVRAADSAGSIELREAQRWRAAPAALVSISRNLAHGRLMGSAWLCDVPSVNGEHRRSCGSCGCFGGHANTALVAASRLYCTNCTYTLDCHSPA